MCTADCNLPNIHNVLPGPKAIMQHSQVPFCSKGNKVNYYLMITLSSNSCYPHIGTRLNPNLNVTRCSEVLAINSLISSTEIQSIQKYLWGYSSGKGLWVSLVSLWTMFSISASWRVITGMRPLILVKIGAIQWSGAPTLCSFYELLFNKGKIGNLFLFHCNSFLQLWQILAGNSFWKTKHL